MACCLLPDLTPSCLELFNLRVGLLQEGVVGGPGGGEWLKGAWPDLCVDPPLQVLAQQRAEQQRRELAQATSSDAPMDPVTFIQTLPSELRRSVLEDMEDSVLAVMPPDIAAEAQALRREQEARQRQLMHERLFGHSSTSALSAILRSPGESPWTPTCPPPCPPCVPYPRPSGASFSLGDFPVGITLLVSPHWLRLASPHWPLPIGISPLISPRWLLLASPH